MSARTIVILAVALGAGVACRPGPDDQVTGTLNPQEAGQKRENLPEGVAAQLDSGSQAYREEDLDGALAHYRKATELGPGVAAAWFGVYMAEHALGNLEEAEEALERARQVVPGATLLHPGGRGVPR